MPGVSLREIAEKVGCSRSTVSYALKNHPSISVGMREKIKQVADELGWHPNAELARHMSLVGESLPSSSLPNLGIIIHMSQKVLESGHAPRMQYLGAVEYARSRGYSVDIFNLVDAPLSAARLKSILKARGIQGLVFIATIAPEIPMDYLEMGHDFSCVVTGVSYLDEPFHVTMPDLTSASRIAVRQVEALGYRRPGVILPEGLDRPLEWDFGAGIAAGQMSLSPSNRLPILYAGEDESHIPEHETERCAQWIFEHKPDVVITTDWERVPKVLDHPRLKRRKRPPVFTLDYYPGQTGVAGGVDAQHREVGKAAIDLVVAQLHRRESGLPAVQQVVLIEGVWRTPAELEAAS